ncbi:MAG: ABC transporter substrate-binding protein [Betaproteobacteria bacterium]|nr:ABC transporter substrate-binding protein [Betaproteobacteria bacterium]
MRRHLSVVLALLIGATGALSVSAKSFRWSAQGDYLTADPHAQNESMTNSINGQVYEGLVVRGKKLEVLPQLATSWKQTGPNTWVFNLRKDVKFHDGAPFTADDVVFSINRAQGETSQFRVYANAIGQPRKIDSHTVELTTPVPNPVQLEMLAANIYMMSKSWAEKNNSVKSQDFKNKEENFAARNANGTGPYMLVRRDPDVKTTLKKNPNWWGVKEKRFEGNVEDVVFTPIKNEATRMAALQSNELDFVLDPALQNLETMKKNPQLKIWEGSEQRVIFFHMDQARDELLYSNVKGKNPFKDRRVRQALYQAIDIEAIKLQVMRGLSVPTGVALPAPTAAGIPAANQQRPKFDIAAAKKLMAEAGYEKGFEVTLDCPNNRYLNDERICIAVAGMLAKINVNVKVNAMPRAQFFPKAEKHDTSMAMLGWGGATTDAIFTLKPVMRSPNDKGAGTFNYGNVKNAKFDELVDKIEGEIDMKKRQTMIIEAVKLYTDEVHVIPMHRQMIPWASRSNVSLVHRADNWIEIPWVTVK